MDEKKFKARAAKLAKGLKTKADFNHFSQMLTKLSVETARNADHLRHEKNAPKSGEYPAVHYLDGANSLKYISWKEYKSVTSRLKTSHRWPSQPPILFSLTQIRQSDALK